MALTRDQIVDAALEVAGDYGLGDLSMRRVAGELGVQAGALYWHVANKQELLIALSRRILDPSSGAHAWPTEPREILLDFRSRLLSVRDGAEIVAVAHADSPAELAPVPQLAAGLDDEHGAWAMAQAKVLARWAIGSVLAQQTAQSLTAAAPSEQTTAAAVEAQFELDFQQGLTCLLPGATGAQEQPSPESA